MLQDYVQIDTIVEQAHQLLLKAAGSKDKLTGVPSGFHDLDKITAGWQASDLVIIAGRRPWVRPLLRLVLLRI